MTDISTDHFERISDDAIALLERIRAAGLCPPGREFRYFGELEDEIETLGPLLSRETLARRLAALGSGIGRLDGPERDVESSSCLSRYSPATPEDSYLLSRLTFSYIRPGAEFDEGAFLPSAAIHRDENARAPRSAGVLMAISEQAQVERDPEACVALLAGHVDAFNELFAHCEAVIAAHGLDTVPDEDTWRAGLTPEEIAATKIGPIDVSAALGRVYRSYVLKDAVWASRARGDGPLRAQLDRFLAAVPEVYFGDARWLCAELDRIEPERAAFEGWILERATHGVPRMDIMTELKRLWPHSDLGDQLGRSTLRELESSGAIRRRKVQGRLVFERVA